MRWTDFANSLEKITIKDIINIINDDLNNKDKYSLYGFRIKRNIITFGKIHNGLIYEPYLLKTENMENLCEELYETLQTQLPDTFDYSYTHDFSGEYNYYGDTESENFTIEFPNFCPEHQSWIFNKVELEEESKKSNKVLTRDK